MGREVPRRRSILIAHSDAAWMDRAKSSLERLGFEVTACPEPAWAVDLLSGEASWDLAAISSEIDPASQARVLQAVRECPRPPKLMILLDNLDTSSMVFRREGPLITHRISGDVEAFVKAVVEQVGRPAGPRP